MMARSFDEMSIQGVSSAFIKEFKSQFMAGEPPMTVTECCDRIIKPRTEESRSSLLDLVGYQHNSRGVEYASPANIHVCHPWNADMGKTLDMLIAHSEQQRWPTYYWIDIFCDNFHEPPRDKEPVVGQPQPPSSVEKWLRTEYRTHIKNIGHVMVVIHDVNNPIAVQKSWCVWEIVCAVRKHAQISFLSKWEDDESVVMGLIEDASGFDATFKGLSFNVEKLTNSNVPYAEILRGCLEQYGWEQVAKMVLECVKEWIIGICKRSVKALLEDKEKRETGYKLASNLGAYLHDLGDLEVGNQLLKKATKIGDEIYPDQLDYPHKIDNMIRLGVINKDLGDYNTSRGIFHQVSSLYDQLEIPQDDVRRNEIFFYEAETLARTDRPEDAHDCLVELIDDRLQKIGQNDASNIKFYDLLGQIFITLQNEESAFEAFKTAIETSNENEIKNEVAVKLNERLGRFYYLRKEYEPSVHHYGDALKIINDSEETVLSGNAKQQQKYTASLQSLFNESEFKLKVEVAKKEHALKMREKERSRSKNRSRSQKSEKSDAGAEEQTIML